MGRAPPFDSSFHDLKTPLAFCRRFLSPAWAFSSDVLFACLAITLGDASRFSLCGLQTVS